MEEHKIQQSFWGSIIKPGEKVTLNAPDDAYTLITAACLGEINESAEIKPSCLKGTIRTTAIDKIDPEKNFEPETVTNTSFAYLTPGKCENIKLNHIFSPLSTIELEVEGSNEIHVSGKYTPVDNEEEEVDEPEEEEDLDDEKRMEKIKAKYVKKGKDESDD